MSVTSISVMMTVLVLNLHYRGPKKNEVPFWLQQLLSLSVANVFRTFGKSKKSNKNLIEKKQKNTKNYPSINGLILSYMNINETKIMPRPTTEVNRVLKIIFSLQWHLSIHFQFALRKN